MAKKAAAKFVPVVSVLNMKGGVGKTTLSTSVFRMLFERKRVRVLLLDLDPQFNLTQTVFKLSDYEKSQESKQTIEQVFGPTEHVKLFEISSESKSPPKVHDLRKIFWRFTNSDPLISLDVVPGDFSLVKYSLMSSHKQLEDVKKRFEKFIEESKELYDLIVMDCNPSSSFLTICALTVCTHVLVPVRPDKYSILGLDMLWEFVHDILPIAPKPNFAIVLNGVPRGNNKAASDVIAELRAHNIYGPLTLANVVYESGILRARTDFTGFATDRRVSRSKRLKQEMGALSDEIAQRLGL